MFSGVSGDTGNSVKSNFKNASRQVERLTFHTRPDSHCLDIVDTQSQAEAMFTLKDLDGKPLPVSSDSQLNIHTGTILIPHKICLVGIRGPHCSSDLFELVADEHDIAPVSCFTVNLVATANTLQI